MNGPLGRPGINITIYAYDHSSSGQGFDSISLIIIIVCNVLSKTTAATERETKEIECATTTTSKWSQRVFSFFAFNRK